MNVSVTGGMLFENQSLGKEFGFLVTAFSYRTEFLQGMALGELNLPLRLSEARGAKKLWQARRLACAEASIEVWGLFESNEHTPMAILEN